MNGSLTLTLILVAVVALQRHAEADETLEKEFLTSVMEIESIALEEFLTSTTEIESKAFEPHALRAAAAITTNCFFGNTEEPRDHVVEGRE